MFIIFRRGNHCVVLLVETLNLLVLLISLVVCKLLEASPSLASARKYRRNAMWRSKQSPESYTVNGKERLRNEDRVEWSAKSWLILSETVNFLTHKLTVALCCTNSWWNAAQHVNQVKPIVPSWSLSVRKNKSQLAFCLFFTHQDIHSESTW